MGANTTLNTKEITKCTLRFYDADFVKKLNDLYKKVGGTQTSFLGMLVREGYKSIAPMYANVDVPVSESVKGVQGEAVEAGIKEHRYAARLIGQGDFGSDSHKEHRYPP